METKTSGAVTFTYHGTTYTLAVSGEDKTGARFTLTSARARYEDQMQPRPRKDSPVAYTDAAGFRRFTSRSAAWGGRLNFDLCIGRHGNQIDRVIARDKDGTVTSLQITAA